MYDSRSASDYTVDVKPQRQQDALSRAGACNTDLDRSSSGYTCLCRLIHPEYCSFETTTIELFACVFEIGRASCRERV